MSQKCATTTRFPSYWSMILVLVATVTALEPPDIISPEEHSTSIKVGSELVIICHGDAPLEWNVPRVLDDRFSIEYSSNKNSSVVSRPYASTLTLFPVSAQDAGIYECHYNASTEGDSIYVHVDDEKNPLVGLDSSLSFLTGYPGIMLTIPCRPTHPSVIIEMKFNAENITLTPMVSKTDYVGNYNPQFGLVIDPVNTSSEGVYTCIGRRNNITQNSLWIVSVTPGPDNITVVVTPPNIYVKDEGVVQLGSNFTVECTTVQDSAFYNFNWTEPAHVINSGRATVSLEPISSATRKKAFKATLTVVDAQKDDSGSYVCDVRVGSLFKIASKYINVYGSDERFLNVTTDKQNIEERGGFDATWVITISSYPTALDFVWRRNGQEIGRKQSDPKYRVDRKGSLVILKILNTSLKDEGAYQFSVKLRDFYNVSKTLDLHLTVFDKPEVIIEPKEPESYFEQGKSYDLICSAKGNPLPNITWWFMELKTENQPFDQNYRRALCRDKGKMIMIKPNDTWVSTQVPATDTSATISFRPTKHGVLFCEADNYDGEGEQKDCKKRPVKVIDFHEENNKGFGLSAPKTIIEQDSVELICSMSKLNPQKELEWKKKGDETGILGDIQLVDNSVTLKSVDTLWSWKKILSIQNITNVNNGKYVCLVGGEEVWNDTIVVNVLDMVHPRIYFSNLNKSEVYKEGDHPELKLICRAEGTPTPNVEWTKDGEVPSIWPDDIKYKISEDGQVLTFQYIRSIASGRYACHATNRNGSVSRFTDIEVEGNGIYPGLIAFIVFCVVVILILMFCLIKNHHNKEKIKRWRIEIQKQEFENGAIENINPELGIEDQANLLPYDNKWEFPRNRLKLGMQLGSGAFGRVMKAEAIGIRTDEALTTVAVKMVKANADESHIKALMSELKIMVHLGRHVNVVNLLGAVTTNLVKKKELFVIVEFCKYGSLLNYMHRHRHTFINQLDPIRGVIDTSIYRQLSRSSAQSEATPRLNYASLTFADTGQSRTAPNGYRTLEEIPVPVGISPSTPCAGGFDGSMSTADGRRSADYQMESMCTDMSFISTAPNTAGGNGGHRRSSCASSTLGGGDGHGHYRGDYQHVEVRPIRSVDLLGWAFQMARGMEYLASRKVLHGDLAARNALLTEGNVVKICDFGLAKEMYKDYKYKKKSEGVLLPVKWMAIESIYYGVFSTQSDVWSFGVVLWELFTLGKTPYPGMEADDRFYKMLSEGYRMEKPPLAPSSMYDIMTECWAHESTVRPTFSTLVDRIGDLMEEGHRQEYVDLNVPYDRMNREWLSGKEDYLSRMSGPDFISASARPTPERGYENLPQVMENSGYLIPNPPTSEVPTQYQNIFHNNSNNDDHHHDVEPTGQFLANNAGYVFMSRPSPEGTAPYVKFDIEPEPPNATSNTVTNVGYVALGLGSVGDDRISEGVDNQSHGGCGGSGGGGNSSSDEDNNRPSPSSSNGGISNMNYVPNNIFLPPLAQVREEDGDTGLGKVERIPKQQQQNGGNVNRRHLRRRKNDSGLGSIDSNQFDASTKDSDHGSGGEDDDNFGDGVLPSQHNLSYVSHSTSDFINGDSGAHNAHQHKNGGLVLNGNRVIA